MGGPGGWWRRKSTPAKVETYTRWSFHLIALSEPTVIAVTAFGQLDARVGLLVMVPVAAHVALAMVTASRALDWTVGRRPQPLRLLWALGDALAAAADPLVVDLGFGAVAVTTVELYDRLRAHHPAVRVVGLEIDPERVSAAEERYMESVNHAGSSTQPSCSMPML